MTDPRRTDLPQRHPVPRTTLPALAAALCLALPVHAQDTVLACPVAQKPARNGDRPDAELIRKLVRCRKGEKPAQPGYDGAVTIHVTDLKIGSPRDWDGRRDTGSGDRGTRVHPVRVTYTEKTHYKTRVEVGEDWIRVMNFFVNAFGEWQSGSEEPVKSPTVRSLPRQGLNPG